MERLIPVEIFRKNSYTFRGITFFPFLSKQPKFLVPLSGKPVPGFLLRQKVI